MEELHLIRSETLWTTLFYRNRKEQWLHYAETSKPASPLLSYYALKQASSWGQLEAQANSVIPH